MTIYDSSGVVIYEAPITASSIIKRELMGDYYIELSFDAVDIIAVGRGCYILHNGNKFEIVSNVTPDDTNNGGYRYTLRFEAQQSQMKRCKVFWRAGANLEVSFSNTTSLEEFGNLIVANMNAFLGSNKWVLGDKPADTSFKTVSFNGDYCWDAVSNIAETFGVEWWTEETVSQVRLCFGKLENGDAVEFKKGDVVSSIPTKKGDSSSYGTRFYVFGSTKNLPEDYASTDEGGVTSHIVEKRLHLPDGQKYIDAWDNLAQEDIVEQVVFFDDIYPTNVETVTKVEPLWEEIIEGETNAYYRLYCGDSPFSLDDIIEGEQIQANFTSGNLIGMTFDIKVDTNVTEFNKFFYIQPIVEGDNVIPNEQIRPNVGDTFILIGVRLPQERIDEAERTLLEVGREYVQKNSSDTDVYDCPTNAVYCHNNDCNYDLGQKVVLIGAQFGVEGRQSRIQGYEKRLYDEYQATYTVGDNSSYSRLSSIEKAIKKNEYGDRVGLEANIIRAKSDSTIPSDYNVYSALATLEYFLHKNRGGIVKGHTAFERGISLYGKMIKYDANKDALIFPFNVVVEKEVAWNSTPEGFDVPTFMDAVRVDNITIKKENGVLTVIGGAGGSGGGVADSVLWSGIIGKPTTIEGYGITDAYTIAEITEILSAYATQSWVTGRGYITGINSSMVIAALGYTPYNSANFTKATIKSTLGISDWALASVKPSYSWNEIGSRPTALSQFSNDSGFITNNVTGDFSASGMVRGNYLSTGYIQISSNIDASLRTSIFGDAGNHWGQIKAFRTGGSASYGSLAGGYAAGILFAMNDTHGFIQLPEAASKAGEAVIGGGTGENIKWSAKLLHSLNYANYALPITGGTVDGPLEVASTIKGNSVIAATRKMRVNAGDSPVNFGYMRAETFSSNRGLVHIGSNYGGSSTITNDAVDVDAIGIYRSVVGVGRTYTGDELKSAYDSNIKFLVEGNMRATGEIVWNSSRVLKNIVNDEPTYLSMADMLKIKPYRYTWKDGRDDKVHAGGIADEVLEVLPEVIVTDSEGIHSMDYGQASFTVATSLAPHVNRHEEEINALKRRVKELEELVTKLLENNGRV